MRLSAYETYVLFLALKTHFNSASYDFFKYHGKVNTSIDRFSQRRDRYQFQKLSRKYDGDEMQDFLVSNLSIEDTWVGNLLDDKADDIYKEYIAYNQALKYRFENELAWLMDHCETPKDLFHTGDSGFPQILNYYMQQEISIQTLIIMNGFIGFDYLFDQKMPDDFLWPRIRRRMEKIKPFFKYDKDAMRPIMRGLIQ
jgi:hypothetical protein